MAIRFSVTFGVVPGYGHGNVGADAVPEQLVAAVWQEEAAKIHAETGIFPGGVVSPSLTVYHADWGCPVGGEVSATVVGSQNPAFAPDPKAYREAVLQTVGRCKVRLQQTTAFVEFTEVDTVYFR